MSVICKATCLGLIVAVFIGNPGLADSGGTGRITLGPRSGVRAFAFNQNAARNELHSGQAQSITGQVATGTDPLDSKQNVAVSGPVTISVRKPVPPLIGVSSLTCSTIGAAGSSGTRIGGATAADCIVQAPPGRPTSGGPRQRGGNQPAAPKIDPIAVAWAALDRAAALAPEPGVHFSPSRLGLTGLASFAWLGPRPNSINATAQVPGFTVYAEAAPVSYRWEFGDGSVLSTSSPGRPRNEGGTISHTYQARGIYDVSVTIVWDARWRTNNSAWQSLGSFTTDASTRYPVRQVVAMLVPGAS